MHIRNCIFRMTLDDDDKRRANIRLALILGGVALLFFVIALWKLNG